ncbi:MAG: helix-turn-helix transcriptional regulator [Clostridia bacterium]|nr:helix-turn-helix transcriptional regulator [Clostridia bacterium]
MFDFGMRIKELRRKHRMTQDQLGRRLDRSKSVISSYENNIKIPPLDILTKIAVIFNVSLDYLVGIDKKEMISVEGLTVQQKELLQTVIFEFKDNAVYSDGLTARQQEILNVLMKEFSKK